MLCPNCNSSMVKSKEDKKEIFICSNCGTKVSLSKKQTTENFSEKKTMENV